VQSVCLALAAELINAEVCIAKRVFSLEPSESASLSISINNVPNLLQSDSVPLLQTKERRLLMLFY
jgi:hypothetical protein